MSWVGSMYCRACLSVALAMFQKWGNLWDEKDLLVKFTNPKCAVEQESLRSTYKSVIRMFSLYLGVPVPWGCGRPCPVLSSSWGAVPDVIFSGQRGGSVQLLSTYTFKSTVSAIAFHLLYVNFNITDCLVFQWATQLMKPILFYISHSESSWLL